MTQTLTTEQVQEIYEAAVHVEATLGDPDAEFDLYCKLDDVGGVEATIRKLIDMLRAANREAQPVKDDGIFRPGDAVGVFNVGCETCPDHLVAWTVKGKSLPVGNYWLYISQPPAPAVPEEISSAIRHLKDTLVACNRFNYCADAVNRVEDACRAAMLTTAPEGGN